MSDPNARIEAVREMANHAALRDEWKGSCSEESPSNRFVCTLPRDHTRWHAAHDLNGNIAFAWPPKHMPALEALAAELDR